MTLLLLLLRLALLLLLLMMMMMMMMMMLPPPLFLVALWRRCDRATAGKQGVLSDRHQFTHTKMLTVDQNPKQATP